MTGSYRSAAQDEYPDEGFPLLAEVEHRHFWFAARNRVIVATMSELLGTLRGLHGLDIGCGTGFVMAELRRRGMVITGVDMHAAALRFAQRESAGMVALGNATHLPFARQFDVALLCDVIEHAYDDAEVLRVAATVLRPQGAIVVTVPADPQLWSAVDAESGHRRRYTRGSLRGALRRAGLRPLAIRYFNSLLYPVQWLRSRRAGGRSRFERAELFARQIAPPPPLLNELLRRALAVEVPLARFGIPFGASLIAISRAA